MIDKGNGQDGEGERQTGKLDQSEGERPRDQGNRLEGDRQARAERGG